MTTPKHGCCAALCPTQPEPPSRSKSELLSTAEDGARECCSPWQGWVLLEQGGGWLTQRAVSVSAGVRVVHGWSHHTVQLLEGIHSAGQNCWDTSLPPLTPLPAAWD